MDDFGLHAGVCEAALQLAMHGRAQAIGCMVGAPAWVQWAPRLQDIDPCQTETGLHLDLTEHPLVLRAQGLGPLIAHSWLRTLRPTDIRNEIRIQLDMFEQHTRTPPAYVDGHQHIHQFPVVRSQLLAELQQRYAANLPWLRSTARYADACRCTPAPWRDAVKPWVIETLGAAALTRQARSLGFRQNGHLLGVHDFSGDEASYQRWMHRWLVASRSADLLMCHPSLGTHAQDPLARARLHEYRVLSGTVLGATLQKEGICLEPLSRTLARGFTTSTQSHDPQ